MMTVRSSALALSATILGLASVGAAQAREPELAMAERVFTEAAAICARDDGAMWGQTLCGPIFLIDWRDRRVIANQPDAEGRLVADGAVFQGVLPEDVVVANTPTEWAGVRWTQLVAELPADDAGVSVLIAHELFHRIQPSLGLSRNAEGGNRHLDTLEGRYLLQLEWRALEAALRASDPSGRRAAVADVVALRRERYRLFPDAPAQEAALEVAEGIPEYTGVRLGLANAAERVAYAIHDLSAFIGAPTFVRSFAYATGPAYGLLLNDVDPDWLGKAGGGARFDQLLADGYGLTQADLGDIPARLARYDIDGALRHAEVAREDARQARLAQYRARLVEGPVVILPLDRTNFQFNPQTLTPLEGYGMVYPTARVTDRWGTLAIESGGALVHDQPRRVTVSASGADTATPRGEGWTLTLNPGWAIQPGPRDGDLQVTCVGECD